MARSQAGCGLGSVRKTKLSHQEAKGDTTGISSTAAIRTLLALRTTEKRVNLDFCLSPELENSFHLTSLCLVYFSLGCQFSFSTLGPVDEKRREGCQYFYMFLFSFYDALALIMVVTTFIENHQFLTERKLLSRSKELSFNSIFVINHLSDVSLPICKGKILEICSNCMNA